VAGLPTAKSGQATTVEIGYLVGELYHALLRQVGTGSLNAGHKERG
jgi:hypothetical protein